MVYLIIIVGTHGTYMNSNQYDKHLHALAKYLHHFNGKGIFGMFAFSQSECNNVYFAYFYSFAVASVLYQWVILLTFLYPRAFVSFYLPLPSLSLSTIHFSLAIPKMFTFYPLYTPPPLSIDSISLLRSSCLFKSSLCISFANFDPLYSATVNISRFEGVRYCLCQPISHIPVNDLNQENSFSEICLYWLPLIFESNDVGFPFASIYSRIDTIGIR